MDIVRLHNSKYHENILYEKKKPEKVLFMAEYSKFILSLPLLRAVVQRKIGSLVSAIFMQYSGKAEH